MVFVPLSVPFLSRSLTHFFTPFFPRSTDCAERQKIRQVGGRSPHMMAGRLSRWCDLLRLETCTQQHHRDFVTGPRTHLFMSGDSCAGSCGSPCAFASTTRHLMTKNVVLLLFVPSKKNFPQFLRCYSTVILQYCNPTVLSSSFDITVSKHPQYIFVAIVTLVRKRNRTTLTYRKIPMYILKDKNWCMTEP